ncbi:MAG: carbohydrate-binding domain-containing protein [Muribaculaceae bacterium]|nr:carbohydrate-binding domain-containing protein [Muribaculaceae bacterium]
MKLTRFFVFSIVTLMAVAVISSCVSDDSDLNDLLRRNQSGGGGGGGDTVPVDTVERKTIEIDSTALAEEPETIPTDEADATYNDYVENATFKRTVTVTYNETGATVTGTTVSITATVNGGHVTINSTVKDVEYILSGTSSNGSFKIYSDHKFKLELRGVDITNPNGAAINSQCSKTMYLVLPQGYYNKLCDGKTYATTGVEDMKGTLFSEGQIIFSGGGSLNVKAVGKNGIASDDYLRFRPGNNIYVNSSAGHGVRANDGVMINGGVLNIEVSADATRGINTNSHLTITGGRTTIITTGGALIEAADTSSCAGIKCDSIFTMKAGALNIKSTGEGGKGIRSNGRINLSGGSLNVLTTGIKGLSSPKGLKGDDDIEIAAGSVYVYSVNDRAIDLLGSLIISEGYTTLKRDNKYLVVDYENTQ